MKQIKPLQILVPIVNWYYGRRCDKDVKLIFGVVQYFQLSATEQFVIRRFYNPSAKDSCKWFPSGTTFKVAKMSFPSSVFLVVELGVFGKF